MTFVFISPNKYLPFTSTTLRKILRRRVLVYFVHGKRKRIKIFLMVKEVLLLKYERNGYPWSVKWKSIVHTFVGIECQC